MNRRNRIEKSEDKMNDLREYGFGDWFRIFLKVIPAYLLAGLIVLLPVAGVATAVWIFWQSGRLPPG